MKLSSLNWKSIEHGFAGAEGFESEQVNGVNGDPMAFEGILDGEAVLVIVDGTGVQVYIDEGDDWFWYEWPERRKPITRSEAQAWVDLMLANPLIEKGDQLVVIGFARV